MSTALVRYPGGKHPVARMLANRFDPTQPYLEPFAGGASVGLEMLRRGCKKVILVDNDRSVWNLWHQIKKDVDAVIKFLPKVPTVEDFARAKLLLEDDGPKAAAAKIVVLRCSMGAYGNGPIGGVDQTGAYPVGARWRYLSIVRAAKDDARLLRNAQVVLYDALLALNRWSGWPAFVDPPYVKAGPSLYRKGVNHDDLATVLRARPGPWVLTIDDAGRYEGYTQMPLNVAGNRKRSLETIVLSKQLESGTLF